MKIIEILTRYSITGIHAIKTTEIMEVVYTYEVNILSFLLISET